jgi:uncharacterized protein YjbJ (UPF0337 family)
MFAVNGPPPVDGDCFMGTPGAHARSAGLSQQTKETPMNWDRVQGNWKQFSGKVKEQWGKLTDDDMTQIDGNREQLEGKIQARYGFAKDQVKKDVDAWLNRSS